jgi:periplasmic protein TonB
MAPLTKDSVEVANAAGDTAAQQSGSQAKPTSAMRSDALSLEVAVKVHGSRVIEVARGSAPQTEPFEEQTVTMIVFPNGAVLRMSTSVNVSQMLVLTNIKTKQDSICRVLKVRPNSNQGSYVEVEFTHRQPGYWGVQFASEASAAPSAAAPSLPMPAASQIPVAPANRPSASSTIPQEAKPASVTPSPATFAPSPMPESSFISIGSQEKVQDAATATVSTTRPLTPVERRLENPAPPIPRNVVAIDANTAPPAAPSSVSMDELLGDDPGSSSSVVESATNFSGTSSSRSEEKSEASSASASAHPPREIFGNFAGATSAAPQAEPAETFGARLDSTLGTSATKNAGAGKNWFLIAACVAMVVAGLAAGINYFRQRPANSSDASAARAATSAPQPVNGSSSQLPAITPPGQPYAAGVVEPNQPPKSSVAGSPSTTAAATPSSEVKAPANTTAAANHSPAPAKQATPGVTPDMVSNALTARPTSSSRGNEGQADQAPVLDPSASTSSANALPGFSATNAASLPSPEMRPEGVVKIGGNVKEPKLISSVLPQYPPAARASGQQGDVVVETTIDKSGNVVRMHVISGPASLRGAAMDALRRWKYEPSRLDGEPVEVQMQVTIRFRT